MAEHIETIRDGIKRSVQICFFLPTTLDADATCSLHLSQEYSDLTVQCGAKEWKVHKAIVCSQSGFFKKACKGDWLVSDLPAVHELTKPVSGSHQGRRQAPR